MVSRSSSIIRHTRLLNRTSLKENVEADILFNLRTDKICTNELKALLFTRFSLKNKHVNDSTRDNGTSTYFLLETPFERNPKNTVALMANKNNWPGLKQLFW